MIRHIVALRFKAGTPQSTKDRLYAELADAAAKAGVTPGF